MTLRKGENKVCLVTDESGWYREAFKLSPLLVTGGGLFLYLICHRKGGGSGVESDLGELELIKKPKKNIHEPSRRSLQDRC